MNIITVLLEFHVSVEKGRLSSSVARVTDAVTP